MEYLAKIQIMPHKELLDPQGKAVTSGLKGLGISSIDHVRVGKFITFTLTANSAEEAQTIAEKACKELLANPIMEGFEVQITTA